jgi:predicted metalloprotease with PDZ domain
MKTIRNLAISLSTAFIISCGSHKSIVPSSTIDFIAYHINLNDRSNDTFKVEVTAPELTNSNRIFQFASTAPGTYQLMNIGRYVTYFKAYDKSGDTIQVNRISINQFEFTQPSQVRRVTYEISETFDTAVEKNPIYPMCGTSIEADHALINAHAVLGYFNGKQSLPVNLEIEHPENWISGTALELKNGKYIANNYDHIVDSPILLGKLTKASLDVSGTKVDIFTYSENDLIKSEMILESLTDMLISANLFLNGLPVDRYTFLYHFETNNAPVNGAWEHSYSSGYTNQEKPWNKIEQNMKDMASHEFFHIVTPLNIHSEIIQKFNFIEPVPSRHLWLYEGVTEWAAHMMQFRAGQKSMSTYLKSLRHKSIISLNYFDNNISLLDLSLSSYSQNGRKQYGNIYMKGALVAGLLDIRLLELSNGERGLIDIINELSKKYGPNKPFIDATFFNEFVRFTYPEIEAFMNSYVQKSEPLPIAEYYKKIGITYHEKEYTFKLEALISSKQTKLRENWMKKLD